jgi:hypothetical protein
LGFAENSLITGHPNIEKQKIQITNFTKNRKSNGKEHMELLSVKDGWSLIFWRRQLPICPPVNF